MVEMVESGGEMSSYYEEISHAQKMRQICIVAEICKCHPPQSTAPRPPIRVVSEIIEALPGEVEEAPSD